MDVDDFWDLVTGADSMLGLFANVQGLHLLVEDLAVEVLEDEHLGAEAAFDDDNRTPLIRLYTGCHAQSYERLLLGAQITGERSWTALGWPRDAFADTTDFARQVSEVVVDFITLHELSHIVRGHVAHLQSFGMVDLSESELPSLSLPPWRRMALELDADSVALYHMVTLMPFLRENLTRYGRAPSLEVAIATLSLAIRVLFALFSENQQSARQHEDGELEAMHAGSTHPHPSLREAFADQRLSQLAFTGREKKRFQRASAQAGVIFLEWVEHAAFPSAVMTSWLYTPQEIAGFLNMLIDDIHTAASEGWMPSDAKVNMALDAIEAIRLPRK
jgi:hypothetical protein